MFYGELQNGTLLTQMWSIVSPVAMQAFGYLAPVTGFTMGLLVLVGGTPSRWKEFPAIAEMSWAILFGSLYVFAVGIQFLLSGLAQNSPGLLVVRILVEIFRFAVHVFPAITMVFFARAARFLDHGRPGSRILPRSTRIFIALGLQLMFTAFDFAVHQAPFRLLGIVFFWINALLILEAMDSGAVDPKSIPGSQNESVWRFTNGTRIFMGLHIALTLTALALGNGLWSRMGWVFPFYALWFAIDQLIIIGRVFAANHPRGGATDSAPDELLPANDQDSSASRAKFFQDLLEDFALSKRETEILRLVVDGKSNRDISGILHISEKTVRNHISNLYLKCGAENRVDLIYTFTPA